MRKQTIFEGDILPSNKCGNFEVIEYTDAHDIRVRFVTTGTVIKTASSHIKRGLVRDPYAPSLYGIGITGSKYPTNVGDKLHPVYRKWSGMFARCYGTNESTESYIRNNVTVHEYFHSYENFWEFFHELPNHEKSDWNLDKDLLGGLVYGPDTVCLIPPEINMAMIVNTVRNSSGFPGVRKSGRKFSARLMKFDIETYLGTYSTPELAYEAYRKAKNAWVVELATRYKDELPHELYEKLVNWFPVV